MRELYLRKPLLRQAIQLNIIYNTILYNTIHNPFTYPNLYSKSSRKRPASIVLGRGRLREPILVNNQLQLRPLFRIPEVVVYESFDCITLYINNPFSHNPLHVHYWCFLLHESEHYNVYLTFFSNEMIPTLSTLFS